MKNYEKKVDNYKIVFIFALRSKQNYRIHSFAFAHS